MPSPRATGLRCVALSTLVAVGSLAIPGVASAARVTSLKPWAATNTYLAKDDIDGRTQPRLNPRDKVNHVRKGQWVRIQCQTTGEPAYGSNLWVKVGGYYVPDQLLKTYTNGRLQGAPECRRPAPGPANPAPQPTPQPPATSALWQVAQNAGFGPLPSGTKRIVETTAARTAHPGVVMFRFFIPNSQAGGRLLKGDGRGWNSFPSQSVASRASIFWDTQTGRVALTVDPTHISDSLPSSFWGVKYHDFPGPFTGGVFWPKKYPLPAGIRGGATHAALPITNYSSESSVRSTDFRARERNTAAIYGSGRTDTVYTKVSLLNSVTNSIPIGAWSVDAKVSIRQRSSGGFEVHTDGNGYPANEAYFYPKAAGSSPRTIFLRRVHPWAYDRSIDLRFVPEVSTGTVDPGGGIAALDVASDLSCDSRADGGSDCDRDGMGPNPLPNLIAPDSYGTSPSDRAG